jgi:hypothetical protein
MQLGYSQQELEKLLNDLIEQKVPNHSANSAEIDNASAIFWLLVDIFPELLAENNRKLTQDLLSKFS